MVRGRSGECDIRTERSDVYTGLNYAMDLTPLIKEQSIDIAEYVAGYIQRFYDSAIRR